MKKLITLVLLFGMFLLTGITSHAYTYQSISYYNSEGLFLGYVDIDYDDYTYQNWRPAYEGRSFVYQKANHVFVGWRDEDDNLYSDWDYDNVQGLYDSFSAVFEYTAVIENPVEPLPTPLAGTWTQTSAEIYGVRQYTVVYTYPKAIQSYAPIDIVLKYTYVEGVYDIINRMDETFNYYKYRNTLYNHSESFLVLSNVYTIGPNSLYLMVWTESTTNALDKLTMFMNGLEFYEVEPAYYLHNMLQRNIPTESITQEMLDTEWENGYLKALAVMEDYYKLKTATEVEQARSEAYYEGLNEQDVNVLGWISDIFGPNGLGSIFNIQFGAVTLGQILLIPAMFIIVPFVLGLFKGGKK